MVCLKCGCNNELGVKFCTTCGEPTSLNDENNVGKLTVKRLSKFFGFAISFDVFVDKTFLGKLSNGKELSTKLSLGNHIVTFSCLEKNIEQEIVLNEQQKEAIISVKVKMGLITGTPKIVEVKYN